MADTTSSLQIQRGQYHPSIVSNLLFTAGRLLSPLLQYLLIQIHPLGLFNISRPPTGPIVSLVGQNIPRNTLVTVTLPTLLAAKHILWVNYLQKERMTLDFAIVAVFMDLIYEMICTIVFTAASVNPFFSADYMLIGLSILMGSVLLETSAELHRNSFKSKPENNGKLCTTGFWSITRHINYTANVIHGLGYGLAVGGPVFCIFTMGIYISNLGLNAMPSLEAYCAKKYGKQWEQYVKDVPSQFIPGIW